MTDVVNPIYVIEAGNFHRVVATLRRLGFSPGVGLSAADIASAPRVILPGFLPWDSTLAHFHRSGLTSALKARVKAGLPTLVLGEATLLLGTRHRSYPTLPGLGLIDGVVSRLPDYSSRGVLLRLPHLGWGEVRATSLPSPWQRSLQSSFYFAHDHILTPSSSWDEVVAAESEHSLVFPAAFVRGQLLALQFYPELSGKVGDQLFSHWLHP